MKSTTNKKSILIVEDDPDLRDAYVMILESSGYDVSSAKDGEKALRLIEKNGNPTIIFLDLRMPVMDGLEFLRQYRPKEHLETTVVVFSNYDAENEVETAYSLGAERYVLKALAAPKELIRIVESI